jgi:hypothetical protein
MAARPERLTFCFLTGFLVWNFLEGRQGASGRGFPRACGLMRPATLTILLFFEEETH